MTCPLCGHENPVGARFCNGCGTTLESGCPRCGKPNPAGSRFCNGCGGQLQAAATANRVADPRTYTPKHLAEKILTSRSALEGERKQVTVLFADVKGSMDLAEQVDSEEWHKIMDRFFSILSDGVHRFEGTINQYTGDGIMALFGAPIAHEDHAQRACYAALHLKDELRRYSDELRLTRGLNFSVRIGLNSGEVVVGKIGDDLRMDYTAQGHTVGLAARMEQIAQAGSVYLTDFTAKLVSGFFALRDLGGLELKGAHRPVRICELTGVGTFRTKLEVSRSRGFSRFVGRDEELASLEAALGRAMAGNAQIVGVVADAGVGKSRLCFEFAERCRSKGIAVYEAHAVAHGKAIPFLTLLEYLRGYFGIGEQDPALATREKIAGKVLLLDPELTESLPLLFDLLGVSDPEKPTPQMDPEARQRQLFAAMRRLAHAQSRREPTVRLIEDLHWIDRGSEAFLENLVEALPGTRSLLVVNFRPEYHAAWMRRSYYQQLPLAPLTADAIDALLRDLVGADASVKALPDLIRERTGGNPFFIEEVVQALVEDGSLVGARGAFRLVRPMEKVAVPATVQAVLAARIDRLESREKHLLQTAAVIGKEFAEPVLKRVAELSEAELPESLGKLTAAEFIYEEALYPQAEYAFKHPLTQEVAYHTQLADRRARFHSLVARALQALYPDKLDERAAVIAHHVEQAGEALDAARWHARAAQWGGAHDREAAFRHWQRVRKLLVPMTDSQEATALALASHEQILHLFWELGVSEEDAAIVFSEGKTLASRVGDVRALAFLNSGYAAIRLAHGAEDHLDYAREAVRLADESGDVALRRWARHALTRSFLFAGYWSEGLTCAEEAMDRLAPDPTLGIDLFGYNPYTLLANLRAIFLLWMGRVAEGVQVFQKAIQRAREDHDLIALGVLCADYGGNYSSLGDPQVALTHARQGVEILEKVGGALVWALAHAQLGQAYLRAASYAEAVTSLERSRATVRKSHTAFEFEPLAAAFLAEAYGYSGEPDRALRTAEEAVTGARQRCVGMLPVAQLSLARVLLRTKGLAARSAIEAALGELSRLARQMGAKSHEPFICVERAELARLSGNEAARQRELREAHRLFSEVGAPIRAAEVAKELGLATAS